MTDYTVLVLGAGASLPYGLPLGKGLVEKICEILPSNDKNRMSDTASTLYETLTNNPDFRNSWSAASKKDFSYALISFRQKLIESDPKSIDEFLARDFGEASQAFRLIGKLSIAYVIAESELLVRMDSAQSNLPNDHWYRYLWQDCLNSACKSLDDIKRKKLRIVSFNYDRSLEYYLGRRLAATYLTNHGVQLDPTRTEVWAKPGFEVIESDFEITHPYGTLGSLTKIPYGGQHNRRDFGISMAANIKVIGEDRDKNDGFEVAKEWINSAKKVVFLGFSYDQTNMRQLGLEKGLTRAIDEKKENPFRTVNPMTYGFERAERNTLIKNYFSDFNGHESTAAIQEQFYDQSTPITHYLRNYGGLTEL
jgi:hypothetical protein